MMNRQSTGIYIFHVRIRYILGKDLYKMYVLMVNINDWHNEFVILGVCTLSSLEMWMSKVLLHHLIPGAMTQVQICRHDDSNTNRVTAACAQLKLLSVKELEFISFLSGHRQTHGFQRMYNGSKEK